MRKGTLINVGIASGILLGVIIVFSAIFTGVNNTAVNYDQTVQEQKSAISVQLQRRHDLILSLVNTVESSGKFEKSTLTDVIEMRKNAQAGKVDQAMLNLNAVAEAYPDIKTVSNYTQLMTELSVTENLISEQRKTYNSSVKSYTSFIKRFPNGMILSTVGFDKVNYQYLDLNAPVYDTNLFNTK